MDIPLFHHWSGSTRRRAAVWLIAAWSLFFVTQLYAACCAPASTSSIVTLAPDVQVDEPGTLDHGYESVDPGCLHFVDDARPLAPLAAGLFSGTHEFPGLPPPPAAGTPDVLLSTVSRPGLAAVSQAPPDALYLRHRRLLI